MPIVGSRVHVRMSVCACPCAHGHTQASPRPIVSALDFTYNRPRENDNACPRRLAEHLGARLYSTSLVLTYVVKNG